MEAKPRLSIVICTCNREALLQACLQSLLQQPDVLKQVEVIVVDNNAANGTLALPESLLLQFPRFRLVPEKRRGLAFARNTGWQAAAGVWILFLDDDAQARPNTLQRALWGISNLPFDCFGGRYFALYAPGKPRWLAADFGTMPEFMPMPGPVSDRDHFAHGGVFVIKKSLLQAFSGFRTDLGMRHGKAGYGEETELQERLLSAGYRLGHDPLLRIDHWVLPEKYRFSWHVRAAFAQARDLAAFRSISLAEIGWHWIRGTGSVLIKKTPQLFSGYHWKTFLLDLAREAAFAAGFVAGKYKRS